MEFDTEKQKKSSKSFKFLRRTSKVVSSFFKNSEDSKINSKKAAPNRSQSFKYRGEGRKPIRERRKSAGSFRHENRNQLVILKPSDPSSHRTTKKHAIYHYLPTEQINSETPNRRKSALSTIIGRETPYNRNRHSRDPPHNRDGHTDDRHSNKPTKESIKRSEKSLIFTSLQPHPSNNKKVVVAVSRAPRGGQQQINSLIKTNSKHRLVRIKSKSGDVQKPLKIVDKILERRASLQYDLRNTEPTNFINNLIKTKGLKNDRISFKNNSLSSSNYSGSNLSDTSTLTCESDNERTIQGGQLGTIGSLACDHQDKNRRNSPEPVKHETHALSQNTGNQQYMKKQLENTDIMQPIKKQLLDQKHDQNRDQTHDRKRSDGSIKQRAKKIQLMRHASHHGHHTVLNNVLLKPGLQRVIANHDITPDDFITNSVQSSPREKNFQVATRSVSLSNKFSPRKSRKFNKKEQKHQSITSLNLMDSSFYEPTIGSYTSLASRDSFFENIKIGRKYLTKEQVKSADFQDFRNFCNFQGSENFQQVQTDEKVNIHRAKSSTRSVEQLNRVSNGWENNLSRGNLSKAVSESWGKFGKLKCAHQLVSGLRVKKNHSKSNFSSTLAYSTLFTRKQGHTNHNSSKNEVIKMGSLQS